MSDHSRHGEMLSNRVRKTVRHLRKWARRENVTCYRIYDRDIPEVPIVVDWYDGRLHVAEYARGDEASGDAWLEAMATAVASALEVDSDAVFVKQRRRQRGRNQYGPFAQSAERFVVAEGNHQFIVNLTDYIDTGLFLDHRPLRARVESEAGGKRVLNLFCYTAAFTVYAAGGGARSSVSVDLSNTYLDWAQNNFELNKMDLQHHVLRRADVLELLADPEEPEPFDLAIVDPPTFSNSKSMAESLEVQRDHVRLINGTLRVLRAGGHLYFSTNNRQFKLDSERVASGDITDITAETIPVDFRNARIHRCWRIAKPS